MDTKSICPGCRKPLPPNVPLGLCPECLIKAGFPTGTESGGGSTKFIPPPIEELAKLFPQLEIVAFIGKGGMGAVYKARQPALDRFVALKILPPDIASSPGFPERFNREARALARLIHPNIVGVHDFGQAGGLHYLIMEFVDGANLREVERAGRLVPEQALAIVPQICDALQFAHNEGIVHRDIKPENILLDKKGRVKITDFGIAKILGVTAEKGSLTGAKDVIGTPHYMAPEQIEHPSLVDHRADIFSLGVVFYEMLTGELPLGRFAPPSKKILMDVRLDEVVLHALEKEPEHRYQQASHVKTEVEAITNSPHGPAGKTTSRTRRVLITAGAALGLVLLLRLFVIAPYHAETDSTSPEIPRDSYVFVFKLARTFSAGEVIVYRREGKTWIARVAEAGPRGGTLQVSRRHGPPQAILAGEIIGKVVFNTRAEQAIERSEITNAPSASAETWSPDTAASEKPDLQKILDSAKALMSEGSYEAALQRYLWYFNHSRNDAGQRGVRLSFALSDWIELGRRYPKARQALMEIRDVDAREFSEGRGYSELFQEISSINHSLNDDHATLALFRTMEPRDAQLAAQCYPYVQGLLAEAGDYQKCLEYIGDPQAAFEGIRKSWQRMKEFEDQNALRREEQRKRFQEMAGTNSAFANLPMLPTPPKFADDHFVGQTRQLIEILVGAARKSDAEKIRDQSLDSLDDARLKSAVTDAEEKIKKAPVSSRSGSPNPPAPSLNTNFTTPGASEEQWSPASRPSAKFVPSNAVPGAATIDPHTGLPRL
jgi:serine/threonine protein kinase